MLSPEFICGELVFVWKMQLPDVQLPGCKSTAAAFHWLPGVALMPRTKVSSFDLSWTLIPPPELYGSLFESGSVNVVST
jgi:hypothetical protein